MKFNHRLLVIIVLITVALVFSTAVNIWIVMKSRVLTALPEVPEKALEAVKEDQPQEAFRVAQKVDTELAGDASRGLKNLEEEGWKSVEEMKETLDILKGHLSVMRKDLQLSNISAMDAASRHLDSNQLLFERLNSDPNFLKSKHVVRLLELAEMLKNKTSQDSNNEVHVVKHDESLPLHPPPEQTKDDNRLLLANLTESMLKELQTQVDTILIKRSKRRKKKGLPIQTLHREIRPSAWQIFHNHINQYELYNEFNSAVDQLLHDLAHKTIIGLREIKDLGTQIKLVLKLNYGGQALFKPMRFSKDAEANPNHYIFDDYERHHAEIAAFHLDRVFGFHRVPPVSGRYVNLTRDIERFASSKLKKTFFTSPAHNRCFYGICDTYCDSGQAVCGHPVMVEGSVAVWLPEGAVVNRKHWENPWAQTYSMRHDTKWRHDPQYCSKVKAKPPYNSGRRLLDIMDMAVFDFLSGNMDRHHYHTFDVFGNYTFLLLFDNGRGFGRPRHDEAGLLAPIYQCCLIRATTLQKLLKFQTGPENLSTAMQKTLNNDMLSPVLNDLHLQALDRRLAFILETVYKCGKTKDWHKVILDDGF